MNGPNPRVTCHGCRRRRVLRTDEPRELLARFDDAGLEIEFEPALPCGFHAEPQAFFTALAVARRSERRAGLCRSRRLVVSGHAGRH